MLHESPARATLVDDGSLHESVAQAHREGEVGVGRSIASCAGSPDRLGSVEEGGPGPRRAAAAPRRCPRSPDGSVRVCRRSPARGGTVCATARGCSHRRTPLRPAGERRTRRTYQRGRDTRSRCTPRRPWAATGRRWATESRRLSGRLWRRGARRPARPPPGTVARPEPARPAQGSPRFPPFHGRSSASAAAPAPASSPSPDRGRSGWPSAGGSRRHRRPPPARVDFRATAR